MKVQSRRRPEGGCIDRSRPLVFSFNGRTYQGYAGDTLASALIANDVKVVARSLKYHRPRGVMSAGVGETNAIVQLGAGARVVPNALATQVELYPGLEASSQNCWPSVTFDVGAVNNLLSRLLPAGFYNKTFMWPAKFWLTYEHIIRWVAGVGKAPALPDLDYYERRWEHVDVLVAGAGPSGLAAALAAARSGARVLLADEGYDFGGSLLGDNAEIDNEPAMEWVAHTVAELEATDEVLLLPRTTVFGYHDHNFLTLLERVTDHIGPDAPPNLPRQRLWKVRAKQVVLATGAHERPLVFHNNDRPGVMLASGARTYVNRYAALPGSRAVVFTNNDSAYQAVIDLANAGVRVAAVVDLRSQTNGKWTEQLRQQDIDVLPAHAVVDVKGRERVRAAIIAPLGANAKELRRGRRLIECDLIANSGGWNPVVHLFSQSGGRLRFEERLACFVPDSARQPLRIVGAANGVFELAECLAQGFAAGVRVVQDSGFGNKACPINPKASNSPDPTPYSLWRIPAHKRDTKCFVDFQNDVTASDIELAAREGYLSAEHTKRYTTTGMGLDQGKTGNVNALAILAEELGEALPMVGTTTFRPPYTPVTFGAVAGRDAEAFFEPVRKTPIYSWHEKRGAVFEPVGQWLRPNYYPNAGEDMNSAVRRECLAIRNGVGILDSSTLGRIDIKGPDAVQFLNWVYTNAWDKLSTGRCRYGLMLHEDGMVFDDGVTARVGENHYVMSTTTGGAATVYNWLEEWLQCEWSHLEVYLTSVTTQWASITLAGPKARLVLAKAGTNIDLSPEAFPHMSVREGTVAGIQARVFRVSFTGELSYEVNVPASYGLALWEAFLAAGRDDDISPIGLEAVNVSRTEKGYIHVGQDTDGTVTPYDLGMYWIVSRTKRDFLGKRSLSRSDTAGPNRRHLVGLLTEAPDEVIPEGAYIVEQIRPSPPMPLLGHVTSTCFSHSLSRSIAMALVKNGRDRMGDTVTIPLPRKVIRAKVTEPIFYDPAGTRLHA